MDNPFDFGFYETPELRTFGFAHIGDNVRIAKNCTIIGLGNIWIGNNVRIDVNCSIIAASGSIKLGSFIHIGAFCHLLGRGGIEMADFSCLSQRVSVYTASDDYTGKAMTNSMIPGEFTRVTVAPVHIGRHGLIGSGAVILPGCHVGEGSAIGALSLVNRPIDEWTVAAGTPARRLCDRSKDLLAMEAEFLGQRHAA